MTWTCSYCGHPNLMERSTCSKCGKSRGRKGIINYCVPKKSKNVK